MTGLVRHSGILRTLPKTAGAAMATATIGLNVLFFDSLKGGSFLGVDNTGLFELLILVGGLYVLFQEETGRRSSPWAQSLPLESRTIWTAHARALVLAVSLVIFAMLAVIMGFSLLISRFDPLEFLDPSNNLIHFARPWLVILAVALALGSWQSTLADPLNAPGWGRWRLVLGFGALGVLVLLQNFPMVVALAPVAGSFVWAVRSRRSLPPALTLAERPAKEGLADGKTMSTNGRLIVHWIIVRQLFKWPMTWILGIPMTFVLGMVMGGFFSTSLDADVFRYFNVWITVYLIIAFVGHFLGNLHKVDHLPIPRRLLMQWLIVPSLISLLAGGFIGLGVDLNRDVGEVIGFENDATQAPGGVLVPVDLWRPVWGGEPRTVTAPWGETGDLALQPVIKGLPLHLVQPFTTGPGASPQFVAWQITRAAEAVHGVALDPEEIRTNYLTTGPDGSVQAREGGLTLVKDNLVPARGPLGPIVGLLLGCTVVLSLITFWLVFRACGRGVTRRRIKVAFGTAMGILMLFHLGGYVLLMIGLVEDWTMTALVLGLAGQLGSIGPAGYAVTWAGALLLSWGAWQLCARAFARVEAVRGQSSCLF